MNRCATIFRRKGIGKISQSTILTGTAILLRYQVIGESHCSRETPATTENICL